MQPEVNVEVANVKQDLYGSLDTKEGEVDSCMLAKQRDRNGKDAQQYRVSVVGRWKENFEELINEEN